MYEVINEELGIMACDLEDLTAEQVMRFLGGWKDGARIGTLTMFLDDNDNLVLNKNHKNYVMNLEIAQSYMTFDEEQRLTFKEKYEERFQEEICLMERGICQKRARKEMRRAMETCSPDQQEISVIQGIFDEHGGLFGASIIFQYGVMEGKRQERAKKKRQQLMV